MHDFCNIINNAIVKCDMCGVNFWYVGGIVYMATSGTYLPTTIYSKLIILLWLLGQISHLQQSLTVCVSLVLWHAPARTYMYVVTSRAAAAMVIILGGRTRHRRHERPVARQSRHSHQLGVAQTQPSRRRAR